MKVVILKKKVVFLKKKKKHLRLVIVFVTCHELVSVL